MRREGVIPDVMHELTSAMRIATSHGLISEGKITAKGIKLFCDNNLTDGKDSLVAIAAGSDMTTITFKAHGLGVDLFKKFSEIFIQEIKETIGFSFEMLSDDSTQCIIKEENVLIAMRDALLKELTLAEHNKLSRLAGYRVLTKGENTFNSFRGRDSVVSYEYLIAMNRDLQMAELQEEVLRLYVQQMPSFAGACSVLNLAGELATYMEFKDPKEQRFVACALRSIGVLADKTTAVALAVTTEGVSKIKAALEKENARAASAPDTAPHLTSVVSADTKVSARRFCR